MSDSASENKPIALVADDDATMQFLMQQVLEQLNFQVIVCQDGQESIEQFERNAVELVVLDVEMPGVSGYTACAQIREKTLNRFLPIIMVTGNDDADSVNRCYEAGATDFVSKPINWAALGYRLAYIFRTSQTQSGLQQSESMIKSLVKAIPDTIFRLNAEGQLIDVHTELSAASLIDSPARIPDEDYEKIQAEVSSMAKSLSPDSLASGAIQTFTIKVETAKRQPQHYEARMVPQGSDGAIAIVRDVTDRVSHEKKIHQIAYYDALTDLPNRRMFFSKLKDQLSINKHSQLKTAVMFLDLDRFKNVNDTLGHTIGDQLLVEVGCRLQKCIRDCDLLARRDDEASGNGVARIGGDEFTVVLNNLEDATKASLVAERILESVSLPIVIDGHHLPITTSIGIAIYPDDGSDAESLLKCADTAMYVAKEHGKNTYRFYSRELNARMLSRITLEADLRNAIEHDELEVYYQPKVNSESLMIEGVEALLRWTHPERGSVSPLEIISVAEESDLINTLGHWVLRKACSQMQRWHRAGFRHFHVSVNVSGHQLYDERFIDKLQSALRESQLPARFLELELTETVAMGNPQQIISILNRIRQLGIRLALDDFGTGYSSLSYLSKLPINILKIDKSFVHDVNVDSHDEAVIQSIISLASAMGMEVVAEGVETIEQLDFLKNLGPCTIQGYLFSQPLPPLEIEKHLARPEYDLSDKGAVIRLVNTDRFSA